MLTKFMFARRDNVLLYARCRAPLVNKNYTQIKLQPSLNSTVKLDDYAVYIHFYLKSIAIDNRYDLEKNWSFLYHRHCKNIFFKITEGCIE